MNRIRISLVENNNEIKGTITTEGDGLFMLEAFVLIIETYANKTGVPANDVVQDIYSVMNKDNVK